MFQISSCRSIELQRSFSSFLLMFTKDMQFFIDKYNITRICCIQSMFIETDSIILNNTSNVLKESWTIFNFDKSEFCWRKCLVFGSLAWVIAIMFSVQRPKYQSIGIHFLSFSFWDCRGYLFQNRVAVVKFCHSLEPINYWSDLSESCIVPDWLRLWIIGSGILSQSFWTDT